MSDLLKLNVNDHVEKKNNLSYLSWAWAWAEVLKADPAATWYVHLYGPEGSVEPLMRIGKTAMVHTTVTIKGIARQCMLPVMDHRNKAIPDPDAFQVNTAIMRCMTKAISMHGLGLYIYAGEDLPESDDPPTPKVEEKPPAKRNGVVADVLATMPPLPKEESAYLDELAINLEDLFAAKGAAVAFDRVHSEELEDQQSIYLWGKLGSKVRSALKIEKGLRIGAA